jgi:hypothetical protein
VWRYAEREAHMAGKFEIIKDKRGEYRFHLKAGNGEIIATSEGYQTKARPVPSTGSSRYRRTRQTPKSLT